jgi:transcriptional regulator with XRE-family HTH domain
MDYTKETGRRLKAARQAKKLTLQGLSKQMRGVLSASRLGNYEQGTRAMGTPEALAIGQALEVNPSYLLCVETDEGDMTAQEQELLRNFRALPENERGSYARRISVLALAYKEPVGDERIPESFTSPKRRKRVAPPHK